MPSVENLIPITAAAIIALAGEASLRCAQGEAEYTPFVAAASEEGERAVAGLQLMEGWRASLFAAEPMLANPVCLYVADDGALYVAETFRHHAGVTDIREHMDWLDDDLASLSVEDRVAMIARHEGENFSMYSRDHERIRLIRDVDGDGRADRATVFADGFNHPAAGIGAGLLAFRGAVYYTCIPDLWLLEDENGDDRADTKEVLSTGYGINVALLGHDLHGLRIGPDLRLYFSSGDRGFRVETEHGLVNSPKTGAVLRCNLDGTGLEIVHSGLRNPQELVFDEFGNLWTGDNNSDGGDQARWVHIVPGGDSGWRYPYQWIQSPNARGPWNDEKMWHPLHEGQPAFLVPPIANLANGPSGLAYYPMSRTGDRWRGHFFLADFRGGRSYSGIHTFTVQPRGAFWELGPVEPFVWNTLVTDCDFGPDGALYLTDWVSGWNKTGKGRIFRVWEEALTEDPERKATQAILAQGFAERGAEECGRLLSHGDMRVRLGAEFRLTELGAEGLAVLRAAATRSDQLLARLHGIWGLGIMGRGGAAGLETVLELLADSQPEVRAQALKVLGEEHYGPAAGPVLELLRDPHPRVRFFAALSTGELRSPQAVEPLREFILASATDDPNLRHAGVMGLLGTATEGDLERLGRDESSRVRMAALLVRRRRAQAAIAGFLKDSDPLLVLEAARAIHDVPIEAALPDLARTELAAGAPNALVRRVLNANYRLGGEEQARRVAAWLSEGQLREGNLREGLAMLRTWGSPTERDWVTNFWWPLPGGRDVSFLPPLVAELGADLKDAAPAVQSAWAELAATTPGPAIQARLHALVADRAAASEVRVAALDALRSSANPALGRAVDLALQDTDGALRAAALTALEDLAPDEALPRIGAVLANGELAEQRAAYGILARTGGDLAIELLTSALADLGRGELPAELALDVILAAEENGAESLLEALSSVLPNASEGGEMVPYLPGLFGGDVDRGREIFGRADLSCLRCHAIDDAAGDTVGPDLRGLAGRLSRRRMLEAIVLPNARTTAGYDASVLFLRDGSTLAGRILKEGLVFDGEAGTWLRLLDSDGKLHEVFEDDIEERRGDLSAMPQDLGHLIDRRAMRDLLAFLGSL